MKKVFLPLGWFIGVACLGAFAGLVLAWSFIWHGGMESFRYHRITSDFRDHLRSWEKFKKLMGEDIAH